MMFNSCLVFVHGSDFDEYYGGDHSGGAVYSCSFAGFITAGDCLFIRDRKAINPTEVPVTRSPIALIFLMLDGFKNDNCFWSDYVLL